MTKGVVDFFLFSRSIEGATMAEELISTNFPLSTTRKSGQMFSK
jgi:hypothetical protein